MRVTLSVDDYSALEPEERLEVDRFVESELRIDVDDVRWLCVETEPDGSESAVVYLVLRDDEGFAFRGRHTDDVAWQIVTFLRTYRGGDWFEASRRRVN